MNDDERPLLGELVADGDVDHDLLSDIAGALDTGAPDVAQKRRLLDRVRKGGRLHRFADRVAEMLYIDEPTARKFLDGVDRPDNWDDSPFPKVRLYHVDGGPEVREAITGFVRVPSGECFPEHDHSGNESVLILQGRCRDSYDGRILGPGDQARMAPGLGTHEVEALAGPPLVYLAVVFEGIRIGDWKLGPDVL